MNTLWYEVVLGISKAEAIDLVYTTDLTDEEKELYRHLSSYTPVIERTYTNEILN